MVYLSYTAATTSGDTVVYPRSTKCLPAPRIPPPNKYPSLHQCVVHNCFWHIYICNTLSEVRAPPGPASSYTMLATSSHTLSHRPRPPAFTTRDDSLTSSWVRFLGDDFSPLLEEKGNEITIYPSPVGFKISKAKSNYIGHLKKVLEGTPENQREELKHEKVDEDFGLLELATNAGRNVKRKNKPGIPHIAHSNCNTD